MKEKDCPKKDWSVEQLTEYVQRIDSRMAVDRWRIGMACRLVEGQLKAEGKFMQWVNETFGESRYQSIRRYMRLAEQVTEEELGAAKVTEAYRALGIIRTNKKNDTKKGDKNQNQEGDKNQGEDTSNAKPPVLPLDEAASPMADIESKAQCLAETLSAVKKTPAKERRALIAQSDPAIRDILAEL